MVVEAIAVTLYLPFSHSLKEKRREVKSLIDQIIHRFHVAAAEVDSQELLQKAVIGVAVVSNSQKHAQACLENVTRFIETHTQGEIIDITPWP